MLIDTHAHVNFAAFKEDAEEVIKRALSENVWVVNVGTQMDTSKSAVEMANAYEQGVYAVIGLHPVHTYSQHLDEEESTFKTREEDFNYEVYKQLVQNPKVVGIGECGLDYYRLPDNADRTAVIEKQKTVFIAQIKLAKELNKALVIHCRPSAGTQDAYLDILAILDQELLKSEIRNPKSVIQYEIHSFTGSPETVKEFLKRGAYVGLNGIITFDKTGNMQKVVEVVPLERIVLETDCPYLTPAPHRGKRNEPAYVRFVAEYLARVKGVAVDEVAAVTSANARSLFLLPG